MSCAGCPDGTRIARGCSRPLAEPDFWKVPDPPNPPTCPVEVHPVAGLYEQGLTVYALISNGHLKMDEISFAWWILAHECETARQQWQTQK